MDVEKIRQDFPILRRKINGKNMVYFDNAATSQKPRQVIDAISNFYQNYNANIHRAVHQLAVEATEKFEESREKVSNFINAKKNEIVFTKGSTEGINIVLNSWARQNLKPGDEIVLSVMEHHSNIVPWQSLQKLGVKLKYIDIDSEGFLENPESLISEKTKLISITHASNVLGTINDVEKISKLAKDVGAKILIDGAQSVPHMPVDMKKFRCDFFVFSGHKMLGPTASGVLYAKKELIEEMPPFILGSDIVKEVSLHDTTFMEPPNRFESGTQGIAEAIGLSAAIDYLQEIGMENVRKHEVALTKFALERIEIEDVKIFGPREAEKKSGIISFNLGDIHPHDLASVLNEDGIAIRSGHHCAQPLMKRLGVSSVARASFYIYNNEEEVEIFVESLKKAREVFKLDRHIR